MATETGDGLAGADIGSTTATCNTKLRQIAEGERFSRIVELGELHKTCKEQHHNAFNIPLNTLLFSGHRSTVLTGIVSLYIILTSPIDQTEGAF